MLDTQLINITQVTGAIVIGGLSAWNTFETRRLKTSNAQLTKTMNLTYDDVKGEIDTLYATVERLNVKLNGGDRRAPRAAVTDNLEAAKARRWNDPTTPRPPT